MEKLTAREQEIIELVAQGLTNGEISSKLWISGATVRTYLQNLYRKFDLEMTQKGSSIQRLRLVLAYQKMKSDQGHSDLVVSE